MKKSILGVIIVLFLSFFAVQPLLHAGFFPMHDDTQVARVFEMGKALADGMFPVRWVSDLGYGYGYPIFNFYAPLAYYIGGIITVFGIDALTATKAMIGIGVVLSGISMYFFTKEFWGEFGAVISSLFYVYAPYHALDIYIRGDVAEVFAYAFLPFIFYGLWKVYKEKNWLFVIVGAIGYALLITSHNLSAMMATPFIIGFLLVLFISTSGDKKNTDRGLLLGLTVFLGLLLSAFYWLPALFEMQYTNVISQIGKTANFHDHFVCMGQLWSSLWGFGGSTSGCVDGLSFRIGKTHIILSVLSLMLLPFLYKQDKKKVIIAGFMLVSLLISIILLLDISKPFWELLPPMAFFQYPWRFLLLVSFFSSCMAGAPIWLLQKMSKKFPYQRLLVFLSVGIIIALLFYLNIKLFQPQIFLPKNVFDYTNKNVLIWDTSKISDEYMPSYMYKPQSLQNVQKKKLSLKEGSANFPSITERTQQIDATVIAAKTTSFLVTLAYFPAWHIFVDKKQTSFYVTNHGIIFSVPPGKHVVRIAFLQTSIEKIADVLTICGLCGLIVGIIGKKKLFLA